MRVDNAEVVKLMQKKFPEEPHKWLKITQIASALTRMAAKSRETGTAAVRQGHRPPPTPRPMQPPAEVDGDEYMDDPDTATMEDLIRDDSEIQQVIDDATC